MEGIVYLGILGIIAIFIGVVTEVFDSDNGNWFIGCIVATALFIIIIIVGYNKSKEPTAIDVYRGNTTLEITYKDSIPIDTVVVFKYR